MALRRCRREPGRGENRRLRVSIRRNLPASELSSRFPRLPKLVIWWLFSSRVRTEPVPAHRPFWGTLFALRCWSRALTLKAFAPQDVLNWGLVLLCQQIAPAPV